MEEREPCPDRIIDGSSDKPERMALEILGCKSPACPDLGRHV